MIKRVSGVRLSALILSIALFQGGIVFAENGRQAMLYPLHSCSLS